MRLIDADALQEVITQDWFLDILLTQTGKNDMAKKLVDMIDSVPTAYNVDKVVEELKKEKSNLADWAEDKAFEIGIETAIRIVGKGRC